MQISEQAIHSHHVPISSSVYSTLGIGSPLSTDRSDIRTSAFICVLGSVFLTDSNLLTVCIWRQCLRSFSSSSCKPGPCSPVQIHDVTLLLHSLSWCISVIPATKNIPEMRTAFTELLTGWSWSRSGSNFVTRWWHLSKSAIFFGNQWTGKRADGRISAVLFLLLRILMPNCAPGVFVKAGMRLHLTSLVVFTSSAFLLREPMSVLTSDRCTSQRTKYSSPSRLSFSFGHGRVSRWWIFASNVWKTFNTIKLKPPAPLKLKK